MQMEGLKIKVLALVPDDKKKEAVPLNGTASSKT